MTVSSCMMYLYIYVLLFQQFNCQIIYKQKIRDPALETKVMTDKYIRNKTVPMVLETIEPKKNFQVANRDVIILTDLCNETSTGERAAIKKFTCEFLQHLDISNKTRISASILIKDKAMQILEFRENLLHNRTVRNYLLEECGKRPVVFLPFNPIPIAPQAEAFVGSANDPNIGFRFLNEIVMPRSNSPSFVVFITSGHGKAYFSKANINQTAKFERSQLYVAMFNERMPSCDEVFIESVADKMKTKSALFDGTSCSASDLANLIAIKMMGGQPVVNTCKYYWSGESTNLQSTRLYKTAVIILTVLVVVLIVLLVAMMRYHKKFKDQQSPPVLALPVDDSKLASSAF